MEKEGRAISSEEHRELSAAEAVGGLTPEELAMLEDVAADDPSLARKLEADHATIVALEAWLPREAPSQELLERIMAEVERLEASQPTRRREIGVLRLPRIVLAAAAAAAAIAIGVAVIGDDGVGEPDAVAALAGTSAYEGVAGEAEFYDGDRLRVRLDAPAPPAGHHYEVWLLRDGAEATNSIGELAGDGEHEYRLAVTGTFAAVEISVEPNDGNPAHSGTSLAGGRFTT